MTEHGTPKVYRAGCRCQPCTAANTRAHTLYLLGYSPKLIDGTGTRRRIQALVAVGWTYLEIAQACGRSTRNWSANYANEVKAGRVLETTAADVREAYERMALAELEGPYRTRARNVARKKGWLPPLAWVDIDDPAEVPDMTARDEGVDEVVVERILRGEHRLPANLAERHEVIRRWPGTDNALERLTGWNLARLRRSMARHANEEGVA